MSGICRFLHDNKITSETMIAVSSLRSGIVTSAKKDGTGSAVLTTSGSYSGSTDLEYIVEIDSIAGGAEVGQATFRWSDGGGTWDASAVTTPAVATELNNGAKIAFTTGSGADFVVGDRWYFKGVNLYNPGKMIDMDRDHRYRSAALGAPNTATITLAAEAEIDALVLYDHNLTSGATIHLYGDDAATFDTDGGSPQVDETITWAAGKILHYLATADRTKKYWQLQITDAANPDVFVEIGEIYLGGYAELSRNYRPGFSKPLSLLFDFGSTPYGIKKKRFYNKQRSFSYAFNGLVAADITKLEAILDAIADRSTGELKPFYWNDDSADTSKFWMVELDGIPESHMPLDYYETTLEMTEVMASV